MSKSSAQDHPKSVQTVFLDRDGVLNRKMPEGEYVTRWESFDPLPGVPLAIRNLNDSDIRVIVVSNQRGIALGHVSLQEVEAIHTRFQDELRSQGAHIDAFYFCPHDKGVCDCRKPLAGLFYRAIKEFPEIRPETSVMIGDSLSDVQFGHNLGIYTIFINGDPTTQHRAASIARDLANRSFDSLVEAVESLIPRERPFDDVRHLHAG